MTPAEASPGARRGTDREGGDDGDDGGSPLGPESSLGVATGAARLVALAGVAAPVSPAARRALGDVSHAPSAASPPRARDARGGARRRGAAGSSARPSTGRNLARFLKRRQAPRLAEAERAAEAADGPSGETSGEKILKAANAREEANKENVDPAWAEYEAQLAASPRSARDAEARASAPRAPLAPLAAETLAFRPEEKEKEESLGAFIERATAEAEAEAEAASAAPRSRVPERNDISETSPDPPFFVRDDDDDAYPPTPAESPSPLRSANAETHAAWIKQGYGAIRASAAAAAPRYAEDDEPESETGRGDDDDAWNEYAGDAAGGVGGFDEARVEPFKMASPGTPRAAAEMALGVARAAREDGLNLGRRLYGDAHLPPKDTYRVSRIVT